MTKKFVSMFLALVMCLSLAGISASAIEDASAFAHPVIDFEGEMKFFPFVYTDADEWAWARELIGDCGICFPGYLYLQDLTTKEITKIIDDPVDMFRSDNEILYCLVNGTSIIRTNYWGENQTLLYTSQYGGLSNLEYWEGILLFSDGDHVIRFDVAANNGADMGTYEGIAAIYMAEDTSFTWADAKGVEYLRSADGQDEVIPKIACEIAEFFEPTEMPLENPNVDVAVPYAASVPIVFPLSEYPAGSYFTKNGEACTDHHTKGCPSSTCNCRYYRGGSQCEGFGRYVLDRYAHVPLATNSGWYAASNSHRHDNTITFRNTEDVKLFFQGSEYANYGTYLRLNSAHTVIIADISSTSVTLYDANYSTSDFCVVKLTERTYEKFFSISNFRTITRIVAHSFTGTVEQATAKYHKVQCSCTGYDGGSCGGYTYVEHAAYTPGKNATCAYCGYVGEIWNWAPVIAE